MILTVVKLKDFLFYFALVISNFLHNSYYIEIDFHIHVNLKYQIFIKYQDEYHFLEFIPVLCYE